jgi:hypothetical protein
MRTRWLVAALFAVGLAFAADPPKPPADPKAADGPMVERAIAARKEYQASLVALYQQYEKTGDKERARWAEEELKEFHLINKPSYRLDILDVPPPTLEAKANVKEANDLYIEAMKYIDKGAGQEYTLNQRRSEVLLREILEKYPTSDKIADVAYSLGGLYEGKAFKQYGRAAAYFERSYQWQKGTRNDARMRAAYIYDRLMNERTKAIELYREQIANDTDEARIKIAEKRLAELTARSGK